MDMEREGLCNGPAVAALVAAGVGSTVLGLLTTLAAVSHSVDEALNWYAPVGPLSGKTTLAVVVWLLVWAALDRRWRHSEVEFVRPFAATLLLIAVGLVGTFPPFWDLFQ